MKNAQKSQNGSTKLRKADDGSRLETEGTAKEIQKAELQNINSFKKDPNLH